jgi:hypothetical protein
MSSPSNRSDPPQSGDDVRLVVEALQQLDPLLDIRWEPCARLIKAGSYDALGKLVAPIYEGLWEVVRYDSFNTATWRQHTRICFVTKPVRIAAGLDAMPADGEYAPLGMWLVAFLRQADQWNQEEARRRSKELDALNERLDAQRIGDGEDGIEEAASKQYHAGTKAGGGVSDFHPVRIDLIRP